MSEGFIIVSVLGDSDFHPFGTSLQGMADISGLRGFTTLMVPSFFTTLKM
jgi:hypothetical protein